MSVPGSKLFILSLAVFSPFFRRIESEILDISRARSGLGLTPKIVDYRVEFAFQKIVSKYRGDCLRLGGLDEINLGSGYLDIFLWGFSKCLDLYSE